MRRNLALYMVRSAMLMLLLMIVVVPVRAAAAFGRTTAAASATVSVTIPAISGFDISRVEGKRISMRLFGGGSETTLVRMTPPEANALASYASPVQYSTRAAPGRWEEVRLRPSERTSAPEELLKKVTYEIWSF